MNTTTTRAPLVELLTHQLNLSHWVLGENVRDVTQEESLRAPAEGGNCMNWVLGHIASGRTSLAKILGDMPPIDEARLTPYRRGSAPLSDPDLAVPIEELVELVDQLQAAILKGLQRVDEEKLAEKAPFSPTDNPNETIGTLIAGLIFHDTYHTGQTGILRATLGKKGVA